MKYHYKHVVACLDSNGAPDFYAVIVVMTHEEQSEGLGYAAAKECAERAGFDPLWVCDETDLAAYNLKWNSFDWDSAPCISL